MDRKKISNVKALMLGRTNLTRRQGCMTKASKLGTPKVSISEFIEIFIHVNLYADPRGRAV
jgi:hypothetical protein